MILNSQDDPDLLNSRSFFYNRGRISFPLPSDQITASLAFTEIDDTVNFTAAVRNWYVISFYDSNSGREEMYYEQLDTFPPGIVSVANPHSQEQD